MLVTLQDALRHPTEEELNAVYAIAYAWHGQEIKKVYDAHPEGDFCMTCDMCTCGQRTGACRTPLCGMLRYRS